MTEPDAGLDLAPFLRLLRADVGIWISLGAILFVLGLMTWTSWGSRRALRKCLVLSILAHVGLLLYGGGLGGASDRGEDDEAGRERIQNIRVVGDDEGLPSDPRRPGTGGSGRGIAGWDLPRDLPASDPPFLAARTDPAPLDPARRETPEPVAPPEARPPDLLASEPPRPDSDPAPETSAPTVVVAPARPEEIPVAEAPPTPATEPDADAVRSRPERRAPGLARGASRPRIDLPDGPALPDPSPQPAAPSRGDDPEMAAGTVGPAPDRDAGRPSEPPRVATAADLAMPEADLRARARPANPSSLGRSTAGLAPVTIARAASSGSNAAPPPPPADRPMTEVPEVYRDRLDPDRTPLARRAGASDASERAVEKALDWLARHQDADGRWNAGTKKYSDDTPAARETNHTMHCPAGDVCAGECYYFEADTAMTGLALLAYLGAGYTHTQSDGKYAAVVAKGLQYLLLAQRADGDLRGESRAVGMYCHAMASLALCEAYALSGDERLRKPAERAVDFLVKARATDGLSWRYAPGSASGDTSLLGWAILVLKSAQSVGIDVPSSVRTGALGWLHIVAEGPNRGLAVYRPNEGPYGIGGPPYEAGRNMTPTMTAEAWACRQFLGVGGPGAASDEAAGYLLENPPDREHYNLYYWYYGTLAMFQRGGADWSRWNAMVRDELVAFQKTSGHQAGSWDPKDSRGRYDARGGRIYCTALAAMTLEVYYRYHRPADEPKPAPRVAPQPDSRVRRTGGESRRR